MDDVITLQYKVSPDDFTRAGEASSDVKNKLKQLGISPTAIRKVRLPCTRERLIWSSMPEAGKSRWTYHRRP